MCKLCESKDINITVETKDPDDKFCFKNDEVIGIMFCPLCGRDLRKNKTMTGREAVSRLFL